MADNKASDRGASDLTESYRDNDMPWFFKVFLVGIILWGVVFALYFILGGYNSEKRFDAGGGRASIRSLPEKSGKPFFG